MTPTLYLDETCSQVTKAVAVHGTAGLIKRKGVVFFFTSFFLSWDRASLMYSSVANKMQRYTVVFITVNALHVPGSSSAHHQELKTVCTASGICQAFSASYRYCE